MAQHATLATLREINASVVLTAIRADPPLSRAEVSRRTGMTKPTVANALDLLLAAGLVRQAAPPGETHYGAVYFEPVHTLAHVLALDIGTRFVRGAICDLGGAMLARHDQRIADSAPETVLAAAKAVHDGLLEGGGDRPGLEVAVAGVPGVVDPREGVIRESNRAELEGVPIRARLAEALGVPAEVENDVTLAAVGEHASGAGRGVDDFAFLSIGAGVGAGLVLSGRPHRGHRGAAGEVDNPPPGQEFAPDSPSADALVSWSAALLGERRTPEELFAAGRAGEPKAVEILTEQARRTAVRIAEITKVADVELVVLGGGIGLASADILGRIEAALAVLVRRPPRLAVSGLGDAPVLVGAMARGAQLGWERFTTRRISEAAVRSNT
ncbi:ROK family protein [Spongiactinospora sp. 9N601]|uniref:ROK family protein n=1 Tax=Spongiactinospora sp. 9N601 TaxID=3375149 RepID=UPI0037B47FA8